MKKVFEISIKVILTVLIVTCIFLVSAILTALIRKFEFALAFAGLAGLGCIISGITLIIFCVKQLINKRKDTSDA